MNDDSEQMGYFGTERKPEKKGSSEYADRWDGAMDDVEEKSEYDETVSEAGRVEKYIGDADDKYGADYVLQQINKNADSNSINPEKSLRQAIEPTEAGQDEIMESAEDEEDIPKTQYASRRDYEKNQDDARAAIRGVQDLERKLENSDEFKEVRARAQAQGISVEQALIQDEEKRDVATLLKNAENAAAEEKAKADTLREETQADINKIQKNIASGQAVSGEVISNLEQKIDEMNNPDLKTDAMNLKNELKNHDDAKLNDNMIKDIDKTAEIRKKLEQVYEKIEQEK